MQCQCQVGLHVQFFNIKRKHLPTKYGIFRLRTQKTVLYQIFSPGSSYFFQKKNWTQSCHGESSILNWPLSSLSLLFSGWLRSWMTVCQMMLFERVIGSRCCLRDAAEAAPQQIKLMVNVFAAMLSHHAGADLPLGNKLDGMLFQTVDWGQSSR